LKKDKAIIQILTSPDGGGAEFLGREIAKKLKRLNYNSYIIYFSNPNNIKLFEWEILLGKYNPRDLRNFFLLRRRLNCLRSKYSKLILHSHLTWPLFFTAILSNRNTIKIYTEHNTHNKRRNFYIFKFLERFIYRRYDFIVCISKSTKIELERWLEYPLKNNISKVIYNGSRKFKYSYKVNKYKNKLRIISIGSLTFQKGFDISIKAVNLCRNIIEQYNIYGEGKERKKLENLIKELKLTNIVKIHGFENEIDKKDLNSNLALIPSRWEGFGLVAVEILSAGIPIIANNVNGLNEVLNNCSAAFLINELNEESLSKKIYFYYSRLDSFESLPNKAINHSLSFAFEKMFNEYEEIYNYFAEK
tara:strand:+ start:417 stop:1499 length:1083 start_codon:yes stop_codon:yes gene_type:complete